MWHRIHNAPAGRWLHKCPDAVGGLPPKLAAASLVLTGANYEGLAPAPEGGRPPVLLAEPSEHFGHPSQEIIRGMALLCSAYGGD